MARTAGAGGNGVPRAGAGLHSVRVQPDGRPGKQTLDEPELARAPGRGAAVSAREPTKETQRELYEEVYSTHDERNQRWKALCATQNIGRVQELLARARVKPQRVIDIGCGDGSVIEEMGARGLGSRFVGYEIAPAAVSYVQGRQIPGVERVEFFDGEVIPEPDGAFDLALLHFVIDQAIEPGKLLAEARRIAAHVFVAVVLDDTRRMRAKLRDGREGRFGSLHLYNRDSVRKQLEDAGLTILAESVGSPGVRISVFWADGPWAKARAYSLAGARLGINFVAPRYAEGLYGHSYRAICASGSAPGAASTAG
jgi:SAM-dependent methyltransferase